MARRLVKRAQPEPKPIKFLVSAGVEYTHIYEVTAESQEMAEGLILDGMVPLKEARIVRFLEIEDWEFSIIEDEQLCYTCPTCGAYVENEGDYCQPSCRPD